MTTKGELTYDEFVHRARQLIVIEDQFLDELYPMVRDLLGLAQRVNALASELHAEIDASGLSTTAVWE